MIERGEWIFLAAVCTRGTSALIGRTLRKVIDEIESVCSEVLKSWDGDLSRTVGAHEMIRKSLLESVWRADRSRYRSILK